MNTPTSIRIVDDDALNRRLVLRMLSGSGLHVDEAASGAAAIPMALKSRHDVILLDISMPAIGGVTVARSIRQHYGIRSPRLIACTAHHNFGADGDEESAAQFDTILTKPFVKNDLLRVLGLIA